jgi:prophage regulatory protein
MRVMARLSRDSDTSFDLRNERRHRRLRFLYRSFFMSTIPFDSLPDYAVIRLPVVLAVTGIGRASFLRGVQVGTFPPPVQIGPRSVAWRVGDIRALLASFAVKTEKDANARKAFSARQSKRASLIGAV